MKLKNLLWIDFLMGFVTGIIGLTCPGFLETFLKIPKNAIVIISVITLLYASLALLLAQNSAAPVRFIKLLIMANWLWSLVSVILLVLYFSNASVFGKLFLIIQVVVVGGLAYLEGRAVKRL